MGTVILDDTGKSRKVGMGFDITVTGVAASEPCGDIVEELAAPLNMVNLGRSPRAVPLQTRHLFRYLAIGMRA